MIQIYKTSFFIYLAGGLIWALALIALCALFGAPLEHPLRGFFIAGPIAGILFYWFDT